MTDQPYQHSLARWSTTASSRPLHLPSRLPIVGAQKLGILACHLVGEYDIHTWFLRIVMLDYSDANSTEVLTLVALRVTAAQSQLRSLLVHY